MADASEPSPFLPAQACMADLRGSAKSDTVRIWSHRVHARRQGASFLPGRVRGALEAVNAPLRLQGGPAWHRQARAGGVVADIREAAG